MVVICVLGRGTFDGVGGGKGGRGGIGVNVAEDGGLWR